MNICCCDWFKKKDDWPKVGHEEILWETQARRMLGRRKVESWDAVLKEGTATWQRADKKYELIYVVRASQ